MRADWALTGLQARIDHPRHVDALVLMAIVAVPLLVLGAFVYLSQGRVARHISPRTLAGLGVLGGLGGLMAADLWLAWYGFTWHSIVTAIVGLWLIAVYLPRMRRRSGA